MRMALGWTIAVAASGWASAPAAAQDVSLCPAATYRYDAQLHQDWGVLPGLAGTVWTDADQMVLVYDWADCRPGSRFVVKEQRPGQATVITTIERGADGGFRQLAYPNGLNAPGKDLNHRTAVTGDGWTIDAAPWTLRFRRDGEALRQVNDRGRPDQPRSWYDFRRIQPPEARNLSKWNGTAEHGSSLHGWMRENGGTTYYLAARTTAPLPGFAIEVRDNGEVVWTLFDWNFFPYSVVTYERSGDALRLVRSYDYPNLSPGAPKLTGPIRIQDDGSWRVTTNSGDFVFFLRAGNIASLTAKDEARRIAGGLEYRSEAPSFMEYSSGWLDDARDRGKYGALHRLARGLWPTALGLEYWWESGEPGMTLFNPQGTKKLGFCLIRSGEPATAPSCTGWYENGDPLTIRFSEVNGRSYVRDGKRWQAESLDPRRGIGRQRFTTHGGEAMQPVRFYSMGVANIADGILAAKREADRLTALQKQQLAAQAERLRREADDRARIASSTPATRPDTGWRIPEPARTGASVRGIVEVPGYGRPRPVPRFSRVPRTMGAPLMGGGDLLTQPYAGMPMGLGTSPMMPAVPNMYPNSAWRTPGFGTIDPSIAVQVMHSGYAQIDQDRRLTMVEERHRARMDWNTNATIEIEARKFADQVNRDNPNYRPDPMYYNEYRDRGSSGNVTVNVVGSSGTTVVAGSGTCVAATGACE